MRQAIRFLRGGRVVTLADLRPDVTVLDYLRLIEGRAGTKQGCSDGTCGACTVALGRPADGRIAYEPVTACRTPLAIADGCDLVAVEDLADADGSLHPVQAALVATNASQCGFCTPGMAMSLFTLFHDTDGPANRPAVTDRIAGNLCRCTGYRPIVDAGMAATAVERSNKHRDKTATLQVLAALNDGEDLMIGDRERFLAAPASLSTLMELVAANPDAAVDPAEPVGKAILRRRVAELTQIQAEDLAIILGAGVNLAAAEAWLDLIDPDLGGLVRRGAGRQRRTSTSLGAAVSAAAGPLTTALIALESGVELQNAEGRRWIALEALHTEAGLALAAGELITRIAIPRLSTGQLFRAYRVGKRLDTDPATVVGCFRLSVGLDGEVIDARVVYAGLSPRAQRAWTAEAALTGAKPRDRGAWSNAFAAVRADFTPGSDHAGAARYRTETAQALLGKALIEAGGTDDRRTRIAGFRERTDA